MMSDRPTDLPPLQFIKSGSKYGAMTSARSMASSITFSEVSSTDFQDLDPFMDASFDNQAVMPRRRESVMEGPPRLHDARPGLPQRQVSTGLPQRQLSEAIVSELKLRTSTDAPPSRPTRQQSIASEDSSTREGFGKMMAARTSFGNCSSTMDLSTTSRSASEPTPGYLQPAFCAEIESRMKELTQQAEVFKRIVDIKDRKYGMRTFKQCFIGSEAVDRMLEAGLASTRTEAVELGRTWMKYLGLFQHVTNGHIFKDKYLFYKFQASDNQSNSSDDSSTKNGRRQRNSSRSHSSSPWYSLNNERATINEEPMIDGSAGENSSGD